MKWKWDRGQNAEAQSRQNFAKETGRHVVGALKRAAHVAPRELGIFFCDVATTKMSHLRGWSVQLRNWPRRCSALSDPTAYHLEHTVATSTCFWVCAVKRNKFRAPVVVTHVERNRGTASALFRLSQRFS